MLVTPPPKKKLAKHLEKAVASPQYIVITASNKEQKARGQHVIRYLILFLHPRKLSLSLHAYRDRNGNGERETSGDGDRQGQKQRQRWRQTKDTVTDAGRESAQTDIHTGRLTQKIEAKTQKRNTEADRQRYRQRQRQRQETNTQKTGRYRHRDKYKHGQRHAGRQQTDDGDSRHKDFLKNADGTRRRPGEKIKKGR